VPLCAFGGALAAAFAVYALATRAGRTPIATVVLCGLAVNSIAGALTSLVLSLSVADWELGRQIVWWLMGSLTDRRWEHVLVVAPFVCVAAPAAALLPRELNLLMLGEESAEALGVDARRVKRLALTLAAATAGAAVAVSGIIGFVGLMVPHLVRLVVGPDHRRLLPLSLVAGALLLSSMDLLSRAWGGAGEIRLGILTSGLGGPFFLLLLLRCRRRAETF
jgi:iron complex transport system permease protein